MIIFDPLMVAPFAGEDIETVFAPVGTLIPLVKLLGPTRYVAEPLQ